MTDPTEPREAEAVPVTLMRIEGMVGGVAKDVVHLTEKVTEVHAEVIKHRDTLSVHSSQIQQLQSDAKAAEKAVGDADRAREQTADALEKQNTMAVAKAKDAVDSKARESVSRWAPYANLIAVAGIIVAALAAYAAFKYGASAAAITNR